MEQPCVRTASLYLPEAIGEIKGNQNQKDRKEIGVEILIDTTSTVSPREELNLICHRKDTNWYFSWRNINIGNVVEKETSWRHTWRNETGGRQHNFKWRKTIENNFLHYFYYYQCVEVALTVLAWCICAYRWGCHCWWPEPGPPGATAPRRRPGRVSWRTEFRTFTMAALSDRKEPPLPAFLTGTSLVTPGPAPIKHYQHQKRLEEESQDNDGDRGSFSVTSRRNRRDKNSQSLNLINSKPKYIYINLHFNYICYLLN